MTEVQNQNHADSETGAVASAKPAAAAASKTSKAPKTSQASKTSSPAVTPSVITSSVISTHGTPSVSAPTSSAPNTPNTAAAHIPTSSTSTPTTPSTPARAQSSASIDHLAMIITTYKRQNLLAVLFESILALEQAPWRIIIVDNEQSDETASMVEDFESKVTAQWGKTIADRSGSQSRVVYAPQTENLGGAGGFSAGVKKAYELGAEWFWVMDDDVAVLPDGIAKLAPWTRNHEVIQGSRFDYDGGPFYWQYDFRIGLGIPNPIAPAAFGRAGFRTMNTLCFEGGLFNRRVVKEIGLPDPRFFIYWDDTIYGYRASKVTTPIVIPDVVLRRTREIGNWDIAGLRQLNSTSDMNRYHIMRNRGYMARYFMVYGDYRPFLFGLGTIATAAKELIRLVMVDREHLRTGVVQIAKGWWDSRKLLHDNAWRPMPAPLPDVLDDDVLDD